MNTTTRFAHTAVVAFLAAFAGAGVVAMMGQGMKTDDPATESATTAKMRLYSNFVNSARAFADSRPTQVVGIGKGGWAFVLSPTGNGYIVREDGSFQQVTGMGSLLGSFKQKYADGDEPTLRPYSFTTEMFGAYESDFLDDRPSISTPEPTGK